MPPGADGGAGGGGGGGVEIPRLAPRTPVLRLLMLSPEFGRGSPPQVLTVSRVWRMIPSPTSRRPGGGGGDRFRSLGSVATGGVRGTKPGGSGVPCTSGDPVPDVPGSGGD